MNKSPLKNNREDLLKRIREVSLTETEKASGLHVLQVFMQKNPVQQKASWFIRSPYQVPLRSLARIAGVSALILIVGAGTAFAANRALPGDVLYSVKVHVNEPVHSFFAHGTLDETRVQAEHATTRLDEAEHLAKDNRLDEKTTDEIVQRFQEQSKKVSDGIETLKKEGHVSDAQSVSDHFEQSLVTHEKILGTLGDHVDKKDRDNKMPNRGHVDLFK